MKLKYVIPFVLIFALGFVFYHQLFYNQNEELPSALIGQPVPHFSLNDITRPQVKFSDTNLNGQVSLLNVWATWCYACSLEHPMLLKIKNEYHVPLYSIVYKDNVEDANNWLRTQGNPFILSGNDYTGDTAIDFGVYGTPETFVISKEGKIVYRQIGVINQKIWDEVLYPLIQNLNKS